MMKDLSLLTGLSVHEVTKFGIKTACRNAFFSKSGRALANYDYFCTIFQIRNLY